MSVKELSEELASYIADAEKLGEVREAFREMERTHDQDHMGRYVIDEGAYLVLRSLIED